MNTKKLYYQDSYQQVFYPTVLSCAKNGAVFDVVLNETAFYPEGGGQGCDIGQLGDAQVLSVTEKDGIVVHTVKAPVAVGQKPLCQVDFKARFDKMQQHTGEHILSGIILAKYGFDNVGFHLGAETVTIDVNGELQEPEIEALEQLANEAIYKNIATVSAFPTKEQLDTLDYRSKKELFGEVRIVTIPEYDSCACCGTHLKRTGEVGLLKILSAQKHKGGTRLTVVCGNRALWDYQKKDGGCKAVSQLLSVNPLEIEGAVEKLKGDYEAAKQALGKMQQRLLDSMTANLETQPVQWAFEEGLSGDALRNFALKLGTKSTRLGMAFSQNDKGCSYAVFSHEEDARAVAKSLCAALQGRGGGTKELAQGNLQGTQMDIENFLKEAYS